MTRIIQDQEGDDSQVSAITQAAQLINKNRTTTYIVPLPQHLKVYNNYVTICCYVIHCLGYRITVVAQSF